MDVTNPQPPLENPSKGARNAPKVYAISVDVLGRRLSMTDHLIPAAQYLRMSTDHQQYSLDNQRVLIQKFAADNGFVIVQTYADSSRTGVVLRQRDGLRQLLNDVTERRVGFKAILVYDVSRWGRFQDADESAHYEFLCRSTGIPVHYCAEPFVNDGTPTDTLLKTIKRTMAAEYSRELGVKVAAGQRNILLRGFRGGGGNPGFALRRMLVSSDGTPKQILAAGERKAIQTDRVILVPGPDEEIKWLREMFRLFTEEKCSYRRIAEILNEKGVPYRNQRPWDFYTVSSILRNSKYNGVLTYGTWTRRLHTKARKTPESQWLRVPHPSAKLIDDVTFTAVRNRRKSFTINKSNEELLTELRTLLFLRGKLSTDIIRRIPGATAPNVYRYRFGTLQRAFELIGYRHPLAKLIVTRRRVAEMRQGLMERLQEMFRGQISIRGSGGRTRNWLQLPNGSKISVRFCIRPGGSGCGWIMRRAARESHWRTLVALLNRENTEAERFLLFCSVPDRDFYISPKCPWLQTGIALDDLQNFCEVAKGCSRH
jgi:DNA invertase Pin-like site-specific DNA recombinase